MTTPTQTQTNKKAWIATIGSLLVSLLPMVAQVADWLPEPYGAVLTGIGMILSAITGKLTHQVSNAPKGTELVPVPTSAPPSGGAIPNPWA